MATGASLFAPSSLMLGVASATDMENDDTLFASMPSALEQGIDLSDIGGVGHSTPQALRVQLFLAQ